MNSKKTIKSLAVMGVIVTLSGLVATPVTARAKTRTTTPTALRGEWFQTADEVPHYLKVTKKTLRLTLGAYSKKNKAWGVKNDRVLHLGKKVKKNKTFTITKRNKQGYYTINIKQSDYGSNESLMLKPTKKGKKTILKVMSGYGRNFVPMTNKIKKSSNLV